MADAEANKSAPATEEQQQHATTANQQKKKDKKKAGEGDTASELSPPPSYIADRVAMFDALKLKYDERIAAMGHHDITITLRDGKEIAGKAFATTPLQVAEGISKSLAGKIVVAKVNSKLWDLTRPLEESCRLELLDFDDTEAQMVFWHSSAHMLGEACERCYGCHLEHGPPTDDGFFYDMRLPGGQAIGEEEFPKLVSMATKIASEKQNFERLVMTKQELLEMFKYNDLKTYFIREKIPDGESSTVYRCGPLIDLCLGPHIPNTSRVKAFTVYKHAQAYWLGNANNEQLTRVYGISFPDAKMLKEWEHFREEAAKRDHRLLGRQHELFFFHELSPGSCFFLPHGTRIYNTLVEFMRGHYWSRGFTEVISPNMYNTKLWERSGHWQNYQEHMFSFEVEKEKFALKPMNCPGHCVMFDLRPRSHRELPLRMADFGVLHRNEFSGALTGLTRVRRFQQDDAHIFCTPEQVGNEIRGALDFLKHVYGILGFSLSMALSTRPEKFLGEIDTWNKAEQQLQDALNESGFEWKLNPGDGAFYGPKIDIQIQDAMRRRHQCATIQLDFQLPQRFDLKYQAADGTEARPVMIHRAVLGSVERMIAVLTENYAAKWPFWLSPRQICIVPVAAPFYEYAAKVQKAFHDAGFFVDVDDSGDTLNKKVRNAQMAYYNFIFVVGEKELEKEEVNIRTRDNVVHGAFPISKALEQLQRLKSSFSRTEEFV